MHLSQEASRLVQAIYGREACLVALPLWQRQLEPLSSPREARRLAEELDGVPDSVRNALFGYINQALRLERRENW
ncbi:MAG: hypothetical protein NTV33_10915 [Coprothermobacterota bacterium]|nr:hypothetical protein [Coprothermobacterota bacterium]